MKKLIAVIAALSIAAMALTFTGCEASNKNTQTTQTTAAETAAQNSSAEEKTEAVSETESGGGYR